MADAPAVSEAAAAVAKLHLDDVTGEMVSKSELKKRQKARDKESQRKEKQAGKSETVGQSQTNFKDIEAKEKDLTPNQVRS